MPDIIMDAAYNSKDAVVILDPSEVRLIKIALDVLRYNEETAHMNGYQLINLAGLSWEWNRLTVDVNRKRFITEDDLVLFTGKALRTLYGEDINWEVANA